MSDNEAVTSTPPSAERSQSSESRQELIHTFVDSNPKYYERQFERIGSKAGFTWTFNFIAALLGPVWYGMRGL